MQHTMRPARTGFTLIELLVVIAIIAILASILFPVFSTAKLAGLRASCQNNLRQMSTAFQTYRGDWDAWYPLGGAGQSTDDRSCEWQNAIWKHFKKDAILRCPASMLPDINYAEPGYVGSDQARPRTPVSYLYNGYIGQNPLILTRRESYREGQILVPTKCILLAEGYSVTPHSTLAGTDCHGQAGTLYLRTYVFLKDARPLTGDSGRNFGLPSHGGGNFLFCDGHVKNYQYRDGRALQAAVPWLVHVPVRSDRVPDAKIDAEPWENN